MHGIIFLGSLSHNVLPVVLGQTLLSETSHFWHILQYWWSPGDSGIILYTWHTGISEGTGDGSIQIWFAGRWCATFYLWGSMVGSPSEWSLFGHNKTMSLSKRSFYFKNDGICYWYWKYDQRWEKTWPHIDVTNTRFRTDYTCMLVHICSRRV